MLALAKEVGINVSALLHHLLRKAVCDDLTSLTPGTLVFNTYRKNYGGGF